MEWLGITIALIILMVLILAFIGMWNSNTDKGKESKDELTRKWESKVREILSIE